MTTIEKICDDYYRNGIVVCDNFVSADTVQLFADRLTREMNTFKKAGIGSKGDYKIDGATRGDFIKWIDPDDEALFNDPYFSALAPIIAAFNRRFFLGISSHEHHLAYYPPGTHYEKHVDTFRNTDARVVSSVLYLNTDWEPAHGGELCIYREGEPVRKIEPVAGRLALFESVLPHEVLECHAPRYSITGWFKRNSAI